MSSSAMSNPPPSGRMRPSPQSKVLCGPVKVFTAVKVSYTLATCP